MITSNELCKRIAQNSGIPLSTVRMVLGVMSEEITGSLKINESVKIEKLGTFRTFLSQARRVASPQNSSIMISRPDVTLAKFTRSNALRIAVKNAHETI